MYIFQRFYLLKVNNKSTRLRCGTCETLIIDIIKLNQSLWFYINWLFQGEERLISFFAWNKKRTLTDFDSSYTLFLNHLMEQICTSYVLNLFIMEIFLGKKYVQGWKMYFDGFSGIFRKSIQNIPQNSLIFQL